MSNNHDSFKKACRVLARSVATHRVAQNLTQEDLAGLSGLHPNAISRIERCPPDVMHGPTLRTLSRLADALGVPISALLSEVTP